MAVTQENNLFIHFFRPTKNSVHIKHTFEKINSKMFFL